MGRVCPDVTPGELVRVRVYRSFAPYSDADLLQIIEPGADRIEPACPLSTVCGGCLYQHKRTNGGRILRRCRCRTDSSYSGVYIRVYTRSPPEAEEGAEKSPG